MGVDAVAWIANSLSTDAILALPETLNAACPGPEIWIWDDADPRRTQMWTWEVPPMEEFLAEGICMLDGPGLGIDLHHQVATVRSAARWRGFLADAKLRSRVRAATAKIARALGTTQIIWLPDWAYDELSERTDLTMQTLRAHLAADWGPPQPSLELVDEVVLSERSSQQVWFEETI